MDEITKNKVQLVLGIIVARGGSKRLPRKNLMPLNGKPLIAWTIEAGLAANCIDRLVLSTDDAEIASIGKAFGCDVPFIRPAELANDTTSTVDVVLHAIDKIPGYSHVVLLQPTSPLRTGVHIDEAFNNMNSSNADSCVSVTTVKESPFWMYRIDEKNYMQPIMNEIKISRKQDLPQILILNGAIYISKVEDLINSKSLLGERIAPYTMSRDQSIDIDEYSDFLLAEKNLKKFINYEE
jgi:CMP-N,N'-diacetyllegionaminic acid synthase